MRSKCKGMRASLLIFVVDMLSFFVAYRFFNISSYPFASLFENCFIGVLTSSFTTFFVYASEYAAEKRVALEKVWSATHTILDQYRRIPFLDFPAPVDVVCQYFHDKIRNETRAMIKDAPYDKDERPHFEELHGGYDNWREFLQKDEEITYTDDLDKIIEHSVKNFSSQLLNVVKFYLKFIEETNTKDIDLLLGNVFFFMPPFILRVLGRDLNEFYYSKLYNPIRDFRKSVVKCSFALKKFAENQNNAHIIIPEILPLQREIFSFEVKVFHCDESEFQTFIVYRRYYDALIRSSDEFLAKIYGKVSHFEEEVPVYSCEYMPKIHDDFLHVKPSSL